jgi:hypothetical protein
MTHRLDRIVTDARRRMAAIAYGAEMTRERIVSLPLTEPV